MISVAEARAAVLAAVGRAESETVPYGQVLGRALATPIEARFSLPRFTNSAMDGYALRAADTRGASAESPVSLELVGATAAGEPNDVCVESGCCAQVMTGAPMPRGADSVVIVEQTSGFDDQPVRVFREAERGQNVRVRGEEVEQGTRVLEAGARIGIPELGTLVGFGIDSVDVVMQPKVAVLSTGDELREPGESLDPGEIYNANLHVIEQAVRLLGAVVTRAEVLRDDQMLVRSALESAMSEADVVITSGGVSKGRRDYVRPIAAAIGLEQHFWGVAQKPGKPLFFATGKRRPRPQLLFGLPGNPVSTAVCLAVYVAPALLRWQGLGVADPLSGVTLAAPVDGDGRRHRFVFGKLDVERGQLRAWPTAKLGSHMFTSVVGADCLLSFAPTERPHARGDIVEAWPLPWCSAVRAMPQ